MCGQWRAGAGYRQARREGRDGRATGNYERVYQCTALRCDYSDMDGRCTHHQGYEVGATDRVVVGALLRHLEQPALIEQHLSEIERQTRQQRSDSRYEQLRAELAAVAREYETTVGAQISAFGAGLRDMRGYEERLVALSARREALEREIAAIASTRTVHIDRNQIPAMAARIALSLARYRELLLSDAVPSAEKHTALSLLLSRVVPDDNDGWRLYFCI